MAGNIPDYNPSLGEIRPQNIGAETEASSAYRVNRFYTEEGASMEQAFRQAGVDVGTGIKNFGQAVEDNIYRKELSRGTAGEASLIDNVTQQWDQTVAKADPNDPNVAATFRAQVLQPALDNFTKGFVTERGQDWAQRRTEALSMHFNSIAAHDMADLAAKAVDNNLSTLANSWSNTVMRDPASLPFLLKSVDEHVSETLAASPNIRGEALAAARIQLPEKLKTGLVRAAAIGAIMNSSDPEGTARAYSEQYPDFLDAKDTLVLAKQARSTLRMNAAATKAAQVAQKQLDQMDYEHKTAELQGSLITPDGIKAAGPDWWQQVKSLSLHPGATESKINELINFGERHMDGPQKFYDAGAVTHLTDGILDGTTTQADLMKANNDGTLGDKAYTKMTHNLQLMQTIGTHTEAFKSAANTVKSLVVDHNLVQDPLGNTVYSNFINTFAPQYAAAVAAGTVKPNDLDMSDPNSMIRKALAPLLPTLKDRSVVAAYLAATNTAPDAPQEEGWLSKAYDWFNTFHAVNHPGSTYSFNGSISKPTPITSIADIKRLGLRPGAAVSLPNGEVRYVPYPSEK